jgi:FMN reductase
MADIALIAGSPAHPSRSAAALERVRSLLGARGVPATLISVRDLSAEALLRGDATHPTVAGAEAVVREARAVVVATPVYKASYAGTLKAFLDLLPQDALVGKVALPIATGGSLAHLLALDYALKPLLGALGARHILSGVYLPDASTPRDAAGEYQFDAESARRLEAAATELAGLVRRRRGAASVRPASEAHALATALL